MATRTADRPAKRYGNAKTPMTEPQADMIEDLLVRKDIEDDLAGLIRAQVSRGMTSAQASAFISLLLAHEDSEDGGAPEEEGFYLHDGIFYKVQRARAGHLYVLGQNSDGRFKELLKGMLRKLRADELLTDEQARRAKLI